MSLPLGMADPLFLAELALEMNKSVRELENSMSAFELTVWWPAYFRVREARRRREEKEREGSR